LFTSAAPNSTGDAGDLTIKTNTLLVRNGASVNAATFGAGNGGNLTVSADRVQLTGNTPDGNTASAMLATAEFGATGEAGTLTITTRELLLQDGAQVSAGTWGEKKGGELVVNATESVQVIGGLPTGGLGSSLNTKVFRTATGNGGDLKITTPKLLVQDGAEVAVESFGTGTAGNMTLNARSIRLNNNALLTANTRSAQVDPNSEQATININSRDLIMSRNSNIRTNARGENVIGGNINIDTDVLVAIENSDITANSANFRGGQVRINTQGIFRSPDSNITATGGSSELGGSVEINRPDVDQILGLVELPAVLADTSQLIANTGCAGVGSTDSDTEKSNFTITGRGGLPPSPYEPLSTDVVWLDTRLADITSQQQRSEKPSTKPSSKDNAVKIVPATGWVFDGKGHVTLISHASNANLGSTAACQKK
jgi:large exoprotein involved in heme utilization and adhesion